MSEDIKDKYQYVTQSDQAWTAIAVKGGKFDGVIYKYGEVTFGQESDEGNLPFRFEYDILDSYGLEREEFGDEFFALIGDILVHIIDEQIGENSFEYNKSND